MTQLMAIDTDFSNESSNIQNFQLSKTQTLCVILNGSVFLSPLILGPFLEIGEERDHCPGREITSCPDLSLGLRANLGQMKGNRPVCKRSGVQEITSFDRSMYRKFKFCLRLHKLGAFLKCFSCSHLFVGTVTQRCNSLWFEMDHMRHVISRIVTLQCSLKQNLICFEFQSCIG